MFFAAWIFSSSLLAATTSWSPGTFVNIGVVGKLSKSISIYTNNNRRIVDHLWLIPENERPLYRLEP
jgi:hypothetical protein